MFHEKTLWMITQKNKTRHRGLKLCFGLENSILETVSICSEMDDSAWKTVQLSTAGTRGEVTCFLSNLSASFLVQAYNLFKEQLSFLSIRQNPSSIRNQVNTLRE